MAVKEDLKGQQFNRWKVLEYAGNSEWWCECQCENKTRKKVRTYMLKSGGSKSCGCISFEQKFQDLRGQMFGRWKPIEYKGDSKWLCECQCKNKTRKIVARGDLKSGGSKSCGCLKHEQADIVENYYGDTKVIGYNKENYKWICECQVCHKVFEVQKGDLERGNYRKCNHNGKYIDMKDNIYGNWKAISYAGNYKWLCECQCETKTRRLVSRYDLISGKSTSCGCSRLKYDLKDKQFGNLKVIKYLGNMIYQCECQCENKTVVNVLTCNLINGGTTSCGCIKNASKHTKEQYEEAIRNFVLDTNDLPYVDDLSKILGLHPENIRHNIEKYELQKYINKTCRSRQERQIIESLKIMGLENNEIITNNRSILGNKELDIYIPNKQIAIEFNGTYWHSDKKITDKYYHRNKTGACVLKDIRLIHVFEYEWENDKCREKLLNMLNNIINDSRKTVYARDAEIKQVNAEDTKDFLNEYHLQDYAQSSINLGCYYNNELIGVMTFGKPRFNSKYQYELIRLCWKDDIKVVGGSEKLFSHFVKQYNPESIISYCDISKFTGQVYNKLGFKLDGLTEPNYKWVSSDSETVMSRYETVKHKLVSSGLGTEEQSETEIMTSLDFYKIYDCGNYRYIWTNTENK